MSIWITYVVHIYNHLVIISVISINITHFIMNYLLTNPELAELLGFISKIKILKLITETVTRNPRKSLPRNRNRNSCFGKFLVSAWRVRFRFNHNLTIIQMYSSIWILGTKYLIIENKNWKFIKKMFLNIWIFSYGFSTSWNLI